MEFRHSICNEAFDKWPFADACRAIRQAGYTGIEIAPFTLAATPGEITAAQRAEYRDIMGSVGLQFAGLHWLMVSPKGLHVTGPDADLRRRSWDHIRALIDLSVEKFGRIDCLFNNAGGPAQTGGIEGLDAARFDAGMATLVRSVMLGMKHAAPHMRRQGSGSIINNGSIAGRLAGYSTSLVYGAAKAAVIHLTKCVAMELGEAGIRVNSISPGVIATGIFGKALGLSVEAAEKTPELMHGVYKSAQPIQRAGMPEDIAYAAVFLASDESTFINGHDLVVDGAITGGRNWTQQQQGYVALRKVLDQGKG